MKRRVRPGELVCRCGAYRFPHRFMGGYCDGAAWVSMFFERQLWGRCRDCPLRDCLEGDESREEVCQVVHGQEAVRECPELSEHIRFEGVRLYGMNKPPPKRAGWRRWT